MALSQWPSQITSELWPFAVQHMVNLYNITTPRQDIPSPWEWFTQTDSPWNLGDMKPLFCPVYVLDHHLQEDNNLGKWQQCTQLGVYIGHCHQYSNTIPLIWNPQNWFPPNFMSSTMNDLKLSQPSQWP